MRGTAASPARPATFLSVGTLAFRSSSLYLRPWFSEPEPGSAPTRSSLPSAPAEWVRCTTPEIQSLRRDVAIKALPEDFYKVEERVARFRREAELLAALNHTNVATVHGLEEFDGRTFIVMELVEGETLAESDRRGPDSRKRSPPALRADRRGSFGRARKGNRPPRPEAGQYQDLRRTTASRYWTSAWRRLSPVMENPRAHRIPLRS